MKVVILAGGRGTRISEETTVRPKPMVEIGGFPLLWHIMKIYGAQGLREFIVCLGYKGYVIKEFFANYFLHTSDVTFDFESNSVKVHRTAVDPWQVTLVDTGMDVMTGGRLKRIAPYVGGEAFCCTYGDGVSNVDIGALVAFHERGGHSATLTAVQPPGRFGALTIEGSKVTEFCEKPQGDGAWINGGFFVLEPSVFDLIAGDATIWEEGPLRRLAAESRLGVYRHRGFWHAVDTLRDKIYLEGLWSAGHAPWKVWE